jgi:UDP-N-acetyl-D-galactosamine dehydrogenase
MLSFDALKNQEEKIAIVGLGYVGLPLAIALSHVFKVIGFDVKEKRITDLQKGYDHTGEISAEELLARDIEFTYDPKSLHTAKFIIVAVPTPVNEGTIPDLSLVEKATQVVGENLANDTIVVYESTVYPGVTEEICLPILQTASGLSAGKDFKIGYSPERINPGDKEHTIGRVIKVVSGMDDETLEVIARVYGSITQVFKATSIKVAEAAKVIENTQRDLNIALMNELAIIFNKMNIKTQDVLSAASTKWNFLPFSPGLVGGHCIGVDPYYLTYKAELLGYKPEVILAGRRINDEMGPWIIQEIMKKAWILGKNNHVKVLIGGITFKENVPDVRNSKVATMIEALKSYDITPYVYDPLADPEEVYREYGVTLSNWSELPKIDITILAVAHDEFRNLPLNRWKSLMTEEKPLMVDVKGVLSQMQLKDLGIHYWSL